MPDLRGYGDSAKAPSLPDHKLYQPLALWQAQCAGRVSGRAVPSGHFIPEELHRETAQALREFFG